MQDLARLRDGRVRVVMRERGKQGQGFAQHFVVCLRAMRPGRGVGRPDGEIQQQLGSTPQRRVRKRSRPEGLNRLAESLQGRGE